MWNQLHVWDKKVKVFLGQDKTRNQEEIDVLTGDKKVDTRTKKQKKLDEQKDALSAANWKKIEDRLRIDKKFQENLEKKFYVKF